MAERKKISLAIWGVPSSGYRQLLLKDKAGIFPDSITDNLRQDYYSVIFQTNGYIVSRHFVGTLYNGLREGYRVFSIGVPYGYSFMNWEYAFNQMEEAFKEALNDAENNLQIETNLSRSQIFDDFITDWQAVEVQEQFRINVGSGNASRQGIVKYTDPKELEEYFRDPCRKAFDGYCIVYFTEAGSLAERKLAMQTILISEPAIHERSYSVTIEYYDAQTREKLGEKSAFPKNVSSVKDKVCVEILEAYYEGVELTGALDDNEKWQIQRNDDGMGYTLVIALKPKVYSVKLVCDELDEKGKTDYSKYVKTNVGIIKGREINLIGREKEKEICLSPGESFQKLQVEILQKEDDYIKFKLKKCFVLPLVNTKNKKGCLSVLQNRYKMNISKVELYSSGEHKKLREINLTSYDEISGMPIDYYLVFISSNYENFELSMVDYINNNLADTPVKREIKACKIVLEGEKVKSVLKKHPLTIECKKGKNGRGTFTCDKTEYLLEIPEGETWDCVFKLKGYKPQSERIHFEEKEQKVILHLTAGRKCLFFIGYVIKKWSIPFILGLFAGYFLGDTIQKHCGKRANSTYADSVRYVKSYLESIVTPSDVDLVDTVLPEIVRIEEEDNSFLNDATQYIEVLEGGNFTTDDMNNADDFYKNNHHHIDSDTATLLSEKIKCAREIINKACNDATQYIEVLKGIDFTTDDIKGADNFYKNNKKYIDSATATLLGKKIKCAKEIIKACPRGFDYKSVESIVKQNVVKNIYTKVQQEALQKLMDSKERCSQASGKSIREKLEKLDI